jgi:hypothetical protein
LITIAATSQIPNPLAATICQSSNIAQSFFYQGEENLVLEVLNQNTNNGVKRSPAL